MRIFDSHFHIIDPKFPLVPNHGFLPEPFTVNDYLNRTRALKIEGGTVVSGSFQAFDQTYLLEALKILGKNFVGVTQLPAEADEQTVLSLDKAGVRAVRFNVRRGGSEELSRIREMGAMVFDIAGWHVELYIDAKDIDDFLTEVLLSLPKVSIDHLGLTQGGLPTILSLAEKGVRVKATGFGRTDLNVQDALLGIAERNPEALLFGTDLPCTRSPVPFSEEDLNLIQDTFDGEMLRKVLYENALQFYGLNGKR
ncbi:2-pyrone-4,6-dicarboxylate hydrolase [Leptospira wolffii]|uniref:amidohydrolase family protein n=1 Tax=Leptospira wolffii TaxID=409998 RepID=UPI0010835122|nr:amidohydrolase family protein [Leptospira wolffii]TGK58147.1 2-pyrone-4,6-dicarboxylate hydrolase [Leptospira wolffii]TGK68826.1 2-pyrone-4,6-dicarboxylate hydrolase [Leptospira wolffii]TGK76334.1 2-pyrone-4,6-dicarboxylate hydrolase [Leptospira wolffii]TGL27178.1 2-pyrone-4,6-dicarboxylate hydrolase [Leptospira wolffii]